MGEVKELVKRMVGSLPAVSQRQLQDGLMAFLVHMAPVVRTFVGLTGTALGSGSRWQVRMKVGGAIWTLSAQQAPKGGVRGSFSAKPSSSHGLYLEIANFAYKRPLWKARLSLGN